jgi:chemotaxis protein methyltransferase WspC
VTIQEQFEGLLKQAMGLDAASIGTPSVERAVQERLAACKLDAHTYLERVRSSETELQALIEAVVVPETWFFRDREAFNALSRFANDEWLPAHVHGMLRVLSLPCSTGEEPYSMAMALLDSGFPANRFGIDAVDISERALSRAAHATYGRNSFRGQDLAFRDRHFETTPEGHRLNDAVRRHVKFHHANLFDPGFLPGVGIYDFVFCRNVLIYFDRATQDQAVRVLDRLLSPKGVLFVAPSETGLLMSHSFASAKIPLAFAFRKAPAMVGPAKPALARPRLSAAPKAGTRVSKLSKPPRPRSLKPTRIPSKKPAPRRASLPPAGLAEAALLADQGKLAPAMKVCEAHLESHGPSASAFHLLGVISDASGNRKAAAEFYRKALYLDPSHQEALFHLALLLDAQGDTAGANAARARAQRIAQKGKK